MSIENIEDIYKKQNESYKKITGLNPNAMIDGLSYALASSVQDLQIYNNSVINEAFLHTCSAETITEHTGGILYPHVGLKAKGYVFFYGNVGNVVPEGTIIEDDNSIYVTKSEATVTTVSITETASVVGQDVSIPTKGTYPSCKGTFNGKEIDLIAYQNDLTFTSTEVADQQEITITINITPAVEVECLDIGEAGNRSFDHILNTRETLEVNGEAKVAYIIDGQNEETEEGFRQRSLDFMRNPHPPFTLPAIKRRVGESCKFLVKFWVEFKEDKLNVIGINKNHTLSSVQIDHMRKVVESFLPADFSVDRVNIITPVVENVNITIKGLFPNIGELQEEIVKNLRTYFKNYFYNETIYETQLTNVIMNTTRDADKVKYFTFEFDFSKLEAKENTIFFLNEVTFKL